MAETPKMSGKGRSDPKGWRGNGDTCVGCKADLRGTIAWVSHRAVCGDGSMVEEGTVYCGVCFGNQMWKSPSPAVLKRLERERPLPGLLLAR